jgi:hypothetical protein
MRFHRPFRSYSIGILFSVAGLLAMVAAVNLHFDPLLCTKSVRPDNRFVPLVDARLQKTNRLLHGGIAYDALLMGSSRVEQFRQEDFAPQRVFNYAIPSFYPGEANQYLNLFLRTNPKQIRLVYLGLDFYGTNAKAHDHANPPSSYIESSQSVFAIARTSVSLDTLTYSAKMFRPNHDLFTYDRLTLDKLNRYISPAESNLLAAAQLELYNQHIYGEYQYNEYYLRDLLRLRDEHPDIHFVVFLTPETADLFRVMVRCGRLPDYERWMRDVIQVFGRVHNFDLIDPFTMERKNFMDAHHLYPEHTTPLTRVITDRSEPGDRDLERIVTEQTLDVHIEEVRGMAKRVLALP